MHPQQPRTVYLPVTPVVTGGLSLLVVGCVELNIEGYQARIAGCLVQLPLKQFLLLRALMTNAGKVTTRRELIDAVWGPDYPDENKTLNVHVLRLRNLLRSVCSERCGDVIRSVRGVGYTFEVTEWPDSPAAAGESGA